MSLPTIDLNAPLYRVAPYGDKALLVGPKASAGKGEPIEGILQSTALPHIISPCSDTSIAPVGSSKCRLGSIGINSLLACVLLAMLANNTSFAVVSIRRGWLKKRTPKD